jgi:UPF0755 protein
MTRRIVLSVLALLLLLSLFGLYRFFGPQTGFNGPKKYLYIPTGATRQNVLDSIRTNQILKHPADFEFAANRLGYFEKIKPGRYLVQHGTSVFELVRKLRNGKEDAVRLVINKLRLPQDIARMIGRNFEQDSTAVMQYLDSAGYENFEKIIPNTYSFSWTAAPAKIFKRLNAEYEKWWDEDDRRQKAKATGYTPMQVYIIASIVEEETNIADDKGKIASVYFNRLQKNMPLQADPTIRYALNDFTITRIYYGQLKTPSPYNTYINRGLPPGPICTPSPATINAVLNAPKTEYLYFVARPDLRGGSTFTTNLADHAKAAKLYQDSLTAFLQRKAANLNEAGK